MPTLTKDNEMAIIPSTLPRGQKQPHESDHGESDKETTPALDPLHSDLLSQLSSFVASTLAKVDSTSWINVQKKKGKKDPTRSTQ